MQPTPDQTTSGASRELLTFTPGREECGIDILKVQEIRGYEGVTTIANAPEFGAGLDTKYLRVGHGRRPHDHPGVYRKTAYQS